MSDPPLPVPRPSILTAGSRWVPVPTTLEGVTKQFMKDCIEAATSTGSRLVRGSYAFPRSDCGCMDGIVCRAVTGMTFEALDKVLCATEGPTSHLGVHETLEHLTGIPKDALAAMDYGFEGVYYQEVADSPELRRIYEDAKAIRKELEPPWYNEDAWHTQPL